MRTWIIALCVLLGVVTASAQQRVSVLGNTVATGSFNAAPPVATTGAVSNQTDIGADLAGTVNPNGHSTIAYVEWGLTTAYGNTTAQTAMGSGSSNAAFSVTVNLAACNTTYQWRLVATQTDTALTSYGANSTFTTTSCAVPPSAPTVTTTAATFIDATFATLNGTVNPNSSDTTCSFQYGLTTGYGSSTPTTDAGAGSGVVSITHGPLTGLSCGTTYHDRAVCTNAGGTTNGSDSSFTTSACPPGGARTVLTQSDFTSLGRFILPFTAYGTQSSQYTNGMALRYESGTPHLLVYTGSHILEYSIPTPAVAGTPPSATKLKDYGAVDTTKMLQANGVVGTGISAPQVYSICYDPSDDSVYIWYGDNYNSNPATANNPSVIKAQLNYAAGTMTQTGPWNFANVGVKAVQSGCLNIPSYWASVYTPGKTLSAGLGGYFSIVSNGDLRPSPQMFAFAPVTNEATMSELANTPLLTHTSETFLRGSVTPAFENRFDGASPSYFNSWGDAVVAGQWLYSATKHGVLFDTRIQCGVGDYVNSNLRFECGKHRFYLINPDTLAQVALGTLTPSDVQASSFWDNQYYDVDYNTFPAGKPYAAGMATPVTISSITRSGSTATVTTSSAHGIPTDDKIVLIAGADQAAYNIMVGVTIVDSTHFTYPVSGTPTTPATTSSTMTMKRVQNGYPTGHNSTARGGMAFDYVNQKVYAGALILVGTQVRFAVYSWSIP
jgi:hypothetical protein